MLLGLSEDQVVDFLTLVDGHSALFLSVFVLGRQGQYCDDATGNQQNCLFGHIVSFLVYCRCRGLPLSP